MQTQRIYFLDIMRGVAVVVMVMGHSIDSVLGLMSAPLKRSVSTMPSVDSRRRSSCLLRGLHSQSSRNDGGLSIGYSPVRSAAVS